MLNDRDRRIGIKDIARMCNVSPQTVSRVLNKRHDVSPQTRNLIEHVIAETGYRPSALARSLVNYRKTKSDSDAELDDGADGIFNQGLSINIESNNTWVMVGDSITSCQRVFPDNPEGLSEDLGKGYVSFVNGLLTAFCPSHRIWVINRGIAGDTIRELKERWQSDVLNLKPDWLSVCIGINDVWQHFDGKHAGQSHVTLAEYEQTLDVLLAIARPTLKGLILLTPYFIQPRGEPMRMMMDEYGKAVWRLAQKYQAIFMDTQSVFDHAVEFVPVETLTWDRAHLTITGHLLLARAVLQSVGLKWSE
jgi:lysophospholipase L1-like esterase